MLKHKPGVRVSQSKREARSVVEVCQMIRREAVTQRIVGPALDSSGDACGLKHLAAVVRRHRAAMSSVWCQPFRQILADFHKPAPGTFGFECLDCNETAFEI